MSEPEATSPEVITRLSESVDDELIAIEPTTWTVVACATAALAAERACAGVIVETPFGAARGGAARSGREQQAERAQDEDRACACHLPTSFSRLTAFGGGAIVTGWSQAVKLTSPVVPVFGLSWSG